VQTGKCLTIAGGVSTDDNVTALQYDCDTHPSRTWRIRDLFGGRPQRIRNVQTNKPPPKSAQSCKVCVRYAG
jgi:hypothetical protein